MSASSSCSGAQPRALQQLSFVSLPSGSLLPNHKGKGFISSFSCSQLRHSDRLNLGVQTGSVSSSRLAHFRREVQSRCGAQPSICSSMISKSSATVTRRCSGQAGRAA
eukprot:322817-Pleurochrysis_carterae.AAC.1